MDRHCATRSGQALPPLPGHHLQDRLEAGCQADDPITPIAPEVPAR
jgi:hypothetical protein